MSTKIGCRQGPDNGENTLFIIGIWTIMSGLPRAFWYFFGGVNCRRGSWRFGGIGGFSGLSIGEGLGGHVFGDQLGGETADGVGVEDNGLGIVLGFVAGAA